MKKTAVFLFIVAMTWGCGINMMPTKDKWYAQHYFIMQDFEREIYKDLSQTARLEFQKLFWEARDQESKNEFDRRIQFVSTRFRRENSKQPWNTDRSRIYILNGPPASIEYKQMDNWAMQATEAAGVTGVVSDRSNEDISASTAEVWTYPYQQFFVYYAFAFKAPNEWRMSPQAFQGNRYVGELEKQNKKTTYRILNEDQYRQRLEALKSIK
jgi:GWxTD domain-containing protein